MITGLVILASMMCGARFPWWVSAAIAADIILAMPRAIPQAMAFWL